MDFEFDSGIFMTATLMIPLDFGGLLDPSGVIPRQGGIDLNFALVGVCFLLGLIGLIKNNFSHDKRISKNRHFA
jgi:hypothetical protein